jgi:hypothetical protein
MAERLGDCVSGCSSIERKCGVETSQAVRDHLRDASGATESPHVVHIIRVMEHDVLGVEDETIWALGASQGDDQWLQMLGHFEPSARIDGLARRNPEHAAFIIDVACDSDSNLSLT